MIDFRVQSNNSVLVIMAGTIGKNPRKQRFHAAPATTHIVEVEQFSNQFGPDSQYVFSSSIVEPTPQTPEHKVKSLGPNGIGNKHQRKPETRYLRVLACKSKGPFEDIGWSDIQTNFSDEGRVSLGIESNRGKRFQYLLVGSRSQRYEFER